MGYFLFVYFLLIILYSLLINFKDLEDTEEEEDEEIDTGVRIHVIPSSPSSKSYSLPPHQTTHNNNNHDEHSGKRTSPRSQPSLPAGSKIFLGGGAKGLASWILRTDKDGVMFTSQDSSD